MLLRNLAAGKHSHILCSIPSKCVRKMMTRVSPPAMSVQAGQDFHSRCSQTIPTLLSTLVALQHAHILIGGSSALPVSLIERHTATHWWSHLTASGSNTQPPPFFCSQRRGLVQRISHRRSTSGASTNAPFPRSQGTAVIFHVTFWAAKSRSKSSAIRRLGRLQASAGSV